MGKRRLSTFSLHILVQIQGEVEEEEERLPVYTEIAVVVTDISLPLYQSFRLWFVPRLSGSRVRSHGRVKV